jgi:hypothetical protein
MDIKTTLSTAKVATLAWVAALWGKIKNYVIGVLGLITIVLLGYEKYQANKVSKLQGQLGLLQTQKEADDLQIKINGAISDATANGVSADNLVALAQALETKRASLTTTPGQTNQQLSDSLGQELK